MERVRKKGNGKSSKFVLRSDRCAGICLQRPICKLTVRTACRCRGGVGGLADVGVFVRGSGEILLAAKRSKMDRAIKFFCPNWETNYSECVGIAHYDTLGAQFVLRGADMREKVTTGALRVPDFVMILLHQSKCSCQSTTRQGK